MKRAPEAPAAKASTSLFFFLCSIVGRIFQHDAEHPLMSENFTKIKMSSCLPTAIHVSQPLRRRRQQQQFLLQLGERQYAGKIFNYHVLVRPFPFH
jgi:hypothetical protein